MEEQNYRVESDLLGELKVPANAYYGVQTQRGINNYHISRKKMRDYPDYIIAIAYVKLAAMQTNHSWVSLAMKWRVPCAKPAANLSMERCTKTSPST